MSEKRYFKIYATRHVIGNENNYVKLFDTLESQVESNDEKLKKKLKNSAISNNLSKHKHYLYNLILRSLNAFHLDSSFDSRFREMMCSVEILFEKGLYRQCWKILKRARELATTLEKIPELLVLSTWEQAILAKSSQYEKLDISIQNDLALIKNLESERLIKQNVFLVYSQMMKMGIGRSDYDIKKLHKLVYNPIISESKTENFWSTHLIYAAYSVYFSIIDDNKNYHAYNQKIVDLFEGKSLFISERPNFYIIALNNLCNAKLKTGKYDEVKAVIEKIRAIPDKYSVSLNRNTLANIIFDTTDIEVVCCLNKGEFEQGRNIIERNIKEVEKNKYFVTKSVELSFYFNAAYTYFILGQHDQCIKWLNKILNDTETEVRQELHNISNIFSLIVHFELGNFSLVDYLIRSTCGEILKHDELYPIENVMISFFTKSLKITKRKNISNEYLSTHLKLQQMIEDPYTKKILEYFDFMSWVESKIENKPFNFILQKKIMAKM